MEESRLSSRPRRLRLAILTARPSVRGPLPKLADLLVRELRALGCEVELLPWGRERESERLLAKLAGRARDVRAARRALVVGGFDAVIVNTAHDWWTLVRDNALVRALPGGVATILQFHGSQSGRLVASGSRLFKLASASLVSQVDGVFVLSSEERDEWQAFSPKTKVSVVRNPAPELPSHGSEPLPPERDAPAGEPVILTVARLIPGKGGADLLRAVARVRSRIRCRLVFAGAGPEETRLRALAEELGLRGSVDFAGHVDTDSLARLYRSADVFALPSWHDEGFPTVVLEAMRFALPIVTTARRGLADQLADEVNALFVPARDEPALAEALSRLLSDGSLRRRMGAANLEKIREFEPDVVARDYLTAVEEVLAQRQLSCAGSR